MIKEFDGEFAFLSNFFDSPFEVNGITFPTVEHYFQAMKTTDIDMQKKIAAAPTPGKAKRMGRQVTLREGWDLFRHDFMWQGLIHKFKDPELREKLLATGDEILEEGNHWHDNFWGICHCIDCQDIIGKNNLGKMLMELRFQIREGNVK